MRFKITLSYDGSAFSGWQIQNNAPTVQDSLQQALSTLLKEEIAVTGAGRTDAGVNAISYVAHFDVSPCKAVDTAALGCKLNAMLPKKIRVHEVAPEQESFHARFGAQEREYKYFIHRKKDPFMEAYSYLYTFPLDVKRMNEAAAYLSGRHDFSCFEKTGSQNKTSICTVTEARWDSWTPDHVSMMGFQAEEGDYLVFTIKADRFLRNMVRAVVGTLLEVGRGKREPEDVLELVKGGSRSSAGESVPGNALFLCGIRY